MYRIHFEAYPLVASEYIKGDFPSEYLKKLWFEEGKRFIVHSTYSNTVKVPYEMEEYNIPYLEYREYRI